jgi:hypothetical protein
MDIFLKNLMIMVILCALWTIFARLTGVRVRRAKQRFDRLTAMEAVIVIAGLLAIWVTEITLLSLPWQAPAGNLSGFLLYWIALPWAWAKVPDWLKKRNDIR